MTIIRTPSLAIECEISGPENGLPIILVHGWPDDVRTWDAVLPQLHSSGRRTFVPYLRGHGPTRFLSSATKRSGQLSMLGQDLLDLADGLGLGTFTVVGHDWGARAAYIASAVAPERVVTCIALSVGWGTNVPTQPLSLRQTQNYWYHWLFALDRGADLLRNDRTALTRYIWEIWNPGWKISDHDFSITAKSFENTDWVDVTLHSYRARWGYAPVDPSIIQQKLETDSTIRVPTLVIHGGNDPCNDPTTSENKERFFRSIYKRVVLDGIGHFPQRQAPEAVADLVIEFTAHEGARPS
jgi:pimeloyl-ACP methyl ester carboxylesterase